ncbi:lantibiotic dehydratase [Micromonospora sp. WMMD980]|uniref:lantibiotic dehydratase n=1 Tax=Micromonospora sp. WMMD980 TaxID=3016088 RepID=UPI0024170CD9|nr:lantibiotic dehydratase [Micromonospora sp. WMMD980]MDG4803703.1 lantibiotic dehydratase [Micromonospora sp. WMMD980]
MASGRTWLRRVWSLPAVAEAISHASPALAQVVRDCCGDGCDDARKVRRAMLAVLRYVLRMTGRPTPFGLLAGVAPARFADQPAVTWGPAHRAVAAPAAGWLAALIAALEGDPLVSRRMRVVSNSAAAVRGEQLVVPHQPVADQRGVLPTEVTIRLTPALRLVLDAAQTPVPVADLVAKLHAEFPDAPVAPIEAMVSTLVSRRALLTNLHAPSTDPDALGHLIRALTDAAGIGVTDDRDDAARVSLIGRLRAVAALLAEHNDAAAAGQPAIRDRLTAAMLRIQPWVGHPLALDLRLDAAFVLPASVGDEVRRAALVFARLSEYPYGTPAWRDYHRLFYERYGLGSLVPLLELVDPDSGIGFPAGYPGTLVDPPPARLKPRDELLLALVQDAVLDGRDEIVLDEALINRLDAGPAPARLPSHLEMAVRVNAPSPQDLRQGSYTLEAVQISRNVGGLTGRFLPVLEPEHAHGHREALAALPGSDADTIAVQVSYPPLDPATAHVTRAPQALPMVLSIAEHRPATEQALTVRDIAVGCDGRRLFLAVPRLGRRIEVSALHSLNLRTHTPGLARFLIEVTRAQCAQVTGFRWGAAAHLPYRPRLCYGRVVLSPAAWRIDADELPERRSPEAVWEAGLVAWRQRRRMPNQVRLVVDDKRLLLDLAEPGHRAVLRRHLDVTGHAVLTEVVDPAGTDWCDGRPHEVIVPLRASAPPPWPRLPVPTATRLLGRDHGDVPGASTILYAQLFGDLRRQDVILAEHLPRLLGAFDAEPDWWFIRYRDADRFDPHLRLRIRLPHAEAFGDAVTRVSRWAAALHRDGLLREIRYPTSYSEPGRWGAGPVLRAAEQVFTADSRAVLAQLQQPNRPPRQALIAAHTVAIASAYLGNTSAGMRWLVERLPATAPSQSTPRPVYRAAVRLADPTGDWAALRDTSVGPAIIDAWAARDVALTDWRRQLLSGGPDTDGVDADDALRHILHGHYIRAHGIDFDDEPHCLHLARAAALAWLARHREQCP